MVISVDVFSTYWLTDTGDYGPTQAILFSTFFCNSLSQIKLDSMLNLLMQIYILSITVYDCLLNIAFHRFTNKILVNKVSTVKKDL